MSTSTHRKNAHSQETTVASITGTFVELESSPTEEHFPGFEHLHHTQDPMSTIPEQKPAVVRREGTIDPRNVPEFIPPTHPSRTLVLCFDGTGDQFDNDNSNVVQLVSMLKKDDNTKQLVYYQAGIGTYTSPQVASPLKSQIMRTLDNALALYLNAHVMGGYEFLMENYIAGDKICIFGFSRGAYTARSLAGMLHKVGLLPAGNFQQVPFAYKMYTRADDDGWQQSTEFKKAFSVDVPIEFVGVWDTVDSVGIIPKRLPFTTSNTIVRTFRHAVSLDERRAKFKANLWNREPTKNKTSTDSKSSSASAPSSSESAKASTEDRSRSVSATNSTEAPLPRPPPIREPTKGATEDSMDDPKTALTELNEKLNKKVPIKIINVVTSNKKKSEDEEDRVLNAFERVYSEEGGEKMTDVEEVWFSGCHCDIGGGSVSNRTRHSLARIPLRWMIRECFKANTGIMFKSNALFDVGLDPSTLYPYVACRPPPLLVGSNTIQSPPDNPIPIRPPTNFFRKKRKTSFDIQSKLHQPRIPFLGSEEQEELKDILAPVYDQLKIKKLWWLLEVLPMKLRYQRGESEWVSYFGMNLADPRFIPTQKHGFKVHRSVKMRMEAEFEDAKRKGRCKRYNPKPKFNFEPIWVD